jgi:hypothetical protein
MGGKGIAWCAGWERAPRRGGIVPGWPGYVSFGWIPAGLLSGAQIENRTFRFWPEWADSCLFTFRLTEVKADPGSGAVNGGFATQASLRCPDAYSQGDNSELGVAVT